MAAAVRNSLRCVGRKFSSFSPNQIPQSRPKSLRLLATVTAGSIGVIGAVYYVRKLREKGCESSLLNVVLAKVNKTPLLSHVLILSHGIPL